jgi:hypothetical protein
MTARTEWENFYMRFATVFVSSNEVFLRTWVCRFRNCILMLHAQKMSVQSDAASTRGR